MQVMPVWEGSCVYGFSSQAVVDPSAPSMNPFTPSSRNRRDEISFLSARRRSRHSRGTLMNTFNPSGSLAKATLWISMSSQSN